MFIRKQINVFNKPLFKHFVNISLRDLWSAACEAYIPTIKLISNDFSVFRSVGYEPTISG